jgi:pimeloyl-ACP methyl ester carboxylesterase
MTLGETPPGCRRVVIFLPGRRDTAEDFSHHRFAQVARAAGWEARFVAADARMPYYEQTSLVSRLREDVVLPEKARGATELWLVGISLGGLGSLLYAREHPEDLSGIALLAPYLGEGPLLEEIRSGGGLRSWNPGQLPPGKDLFRDLWGWLKTATVSGGTKPAIYLGYGTRDRYAGAHAILATALPPERVFTTPGGHDWRTWERLWGTMAGTCASTGPAHAPPETPPTVAP